MFAYMRTWKRGEKRDLVFYKEGDEVPILTWLKGVPPKVQDKCIAYLAQLVTNYGVRSLIC